MADTVDKKTRSRIMSSIKGKDTRPEMILRSAMHSRGFRYRLHVKRLPGRPDMVFARYKAVCLVHGCFWHQHENCPLASVPATRKDYWKAKFAANKARDRKNIQQLAKEGWRVAVVWECTLGKGKEAKVAARLGRWLKGKRRFFLAEFSD